MRLSGVASQYGFGSAFDARMAGLNINQEELPWWATACLGWLSCYRAIQEGYGKTGEAYRQMLEKTLGGSTPYRATDRKTGKQHNVNGPGALYAIYEDFADALKREMEG